ncbi:hypothetical protein B0T14DRAFT_544431 [Immersiella caudata]|uniref:Uncharacterized protein n=1 Tax=Immersiella caudata TaxID=314043 RepID=A0AA39WW78_9PEZI|nr:hypothetical protein B0T14DRAFT_544431 [Immersiella caudata]
MGEMLLLLGLRTTLSPTPRTPQDQMWPESKNPSKGLRGVLAACHQPLTGSKDTTRMGRTGYGARSGSSKIQSDVFSEKIFSFLP